MQKIRMCSVSGCKERAVPLSFLPVKDKEDCLCWEHYEPYRICSEPGCTVEAMRRRDMSLPDRELALCRDHYMPIELSEYDREDWLSGRRISALAMAQGKCARNAYPTKEENKTARLAMQKSGIKVIDFHGTIK